MYGMRTVRALELVLVVVVATTVGLALRVRRLRTPRSVVPLVGAPAAVPSLRPTAPPPVPVNAETPAVTAVPDVTAEAVTESHASPAPAGPNTNEPAVVEPGEPEPLAEPDWRAVWADLDLTAEEQQRLRAGFRLAWERWLALSEEARQAEIARWQGMRARWDAMSDADRLAASQRLRDRFEDWRRSASVELPEITLD